MNIDNLFGIHENALNLRIKRAEVLASNLANADTPGYKAKDMDFNDVLKDISSNQSKGMMTTNPAHIANSTYNADVPLMYREPLQTSLDGNTVDTQIESAKLAENNMRLLASLRIMDMKIKSFTTALRGE
ncbi:flagellar basal body rod protein FlgB [Candidatus Berkiella aquae]|uniref:Flagellar basal body rod protein FlgB n=1 Tax=Candidatus Berkiella aquae TaxID=295108 RepID=A0A0Q9YLF5_9GAMM|nr:flagellar basal body rod protein FlgB [Candidatus Berkiella aquae]MCS5711447.1 flagellar basal body rod protein FlgB [Candidatus Berkiella aquae]